MSKTLSNVLTVFKVARILAKIAFIFCIIGGVGCLVALIMLPFAESMVPLQSLMEEGIDFSVTYSACVAGLVVCVGEAIFAFMAERYFRNVLSAGTPFTLEGANECFRLGLASIIISVSTAVIAGLMVPLVKIFAENASEFELDASISISTGLFFLFLSLVFKCGAEFAASVNGESKNEE